MTTSTYNAGRSQGQSAPAPHSGFALHDGLASVKQVVDSSEAVENSYSYEAFGQASVGQSDVANPYLFVGGYGVQWESTPSLYFMQARYYGPGVGRFLSEDPYGGSPQDPMSLHRYLYCANGPVSRADASGRFAIAAIPAVWWWIIGAVGGITVLVVIIVIYIGPHTCYEWFVHRLFRSGGEGYRSFEERCEPAWQLARDGDVGACITMCTAIFKDDPLFAGVHGQNCADGCSTIAGRPRKMLELD